MGQTPFWVESISFNDGTRVPVGNGSVVVIVGPNNAGKSRALRELHGALAQMGSVSMVLGPLEIRQAVDTEGLLEWIREHAFVRSAGPFEVAGAPGVGDLRLDQVGGLWSGGPPYQQLANMLVFFGTTEQRLQLAGSVGSFDPVNQQPSNALQMLYLDAGLEGALSDAVWRAFRTRITVNRMAGPQIHLHVGSLPSELGEPVPTNAAYRTELGRLPMIQNEGDGVRSYVGIVLAVTAARYPLVLLDEPEAFLHPPQERQLGRELASQVGDDTQLIVATHSADFLEGTLSAGGGNVTVVRLTREGSINHAAVLAREHLATLWNDPLLRYSRLLDGLFHVGTVLCESDSDCRYYEAVLDHARASSGQPAHDLLFTYTGGKHRLPAAIEALRAIEVEVRVIADFDVLADEDLLQRIVTALGGLWGDVETDWRIVRSAVEQLTATPSLVAVREAIHEVLNGATGSSLTRDVSRSIRDATKVESGWQRSKAGGLAVLPSGEARQAADRLLQTLREAGLFVVAVGELERWAPDIGHHGPAWVADALEQGAHQRTGPHVQFMMDLADSL